MTIIRRDRKHHQRPTPQSPPLPVTRTKALTKAERRLVWDKSGGYCWYCGCNLPAKGWHADHFVPVIRSEGECRGPKIGNNMFGPVPDDIKILMSNGMLRPEMDTIDNMVPACAPCNLFKAAFDVEHFRHSIESQVERARKTSVNFRTAERFGLITTSSEPVVFWYEAHGPAPTIPRI